MLAIIIMDAEKTDYFLSFRAAQNYLHLQVLVVEIEFELFFFLLFFVEMSI
jgi:hypothetical protein